MSASHIIRLGRVKGKNGVLEALKHNKRVLQAERGAPRHIDANKTCLNYVLHGHDSAENISTHAKVQMLKAGIESPRKNAVMAVEIIFSLPVDRHQQDTKPFFVDCLEWVNRHMDGELLSFDVHLDEAAPHAHALILPLINGKMQGNAMKGGRGNIKRLQNLFYCEVAPKYGLKKHNYSGLNSQDKKSLGRKVLQRLQADSVQKSEIFPWVRDCIMRDPQPCAELLDIEFAPAQRQSKRHFVDIARSHGKGSFQK